MTFNVLSCKLANMYIMDEYANRHFMGLYSLCVCGICVCEYPSQWVGSVLLVLVQWARPCIRQVELQGEFCNTWPVSLSHLCGRRKRGKEEEGVSEGGEGSGGGGQRKWLRGDWRDEWQWKVIARGRENNSWGSRREEKRDDSAFIFLLSYVLSLSLHLFLSPIPPSLSFIQQPLRQAWLSRLAPHYSPFQP